MDGSCGVDLSIGKPHRDVLALELYIHLWRQVEGLGALRDTTARGLVRLKAKVLHLYGFLA